MKLSICLWFHCKIYPKLWPVYTDTHIRKQSKATSIQQTHLEPIQLPMEQWTSMKDLYYLSCDDVRITQLKYS